VDREVSVFSQHNTNTPTAEPPIMSQSTRNLSSSDDFLTVSLDLYI